MLISGRFGNIRTKTTCSCTPGNTGWVSAGNGANNGTGTSWTNPTNIYVSDNNRAFVSLSLYGQAQNLFATNFDMSAIPDCAVISQVEVRAEMYQNVGPSIHGVFYLVKGGALTGSSSSSVIPTSTEAYITRTGDAGADPLWSATLTPADVKSTNFGCALQGFVIDSYDSNVIYCDHVQMRVSWTC